MQELLLAAISVLTTILGAFVYILKRKADARAMGVEANAAAEVSRVQAEAQTMIIEAQTKAREVDTHAEQIAKMMGLLAQQMEISTKNAQSDAQWRARLEENERHGNEGYNVIRAVQKETNQLLVNITNALDAIHKALMDNRKLILHAVDAVPEQIQASNREELATFAKVVGGELAVAFAEQMSLQQLSSDLFPFPDAEDPRWETVFIKPRDGVTATLQKQPFYRNGIMLSGPGAQIETTGETVRLIQHHLKGWYIVNKKGNFADGGYWGWLAENRVTIIPPPNVTTVKTKELSTT